MRPERSVDRFSELTDPSRDTFRVEALAEELHEELRKQSNALRNGTLNKDLLAAQFEGQPPGQASRETAGPGMKTWVALADGLPALDRDRFLARIESELARFERIDGVESHITEISSLESEPASGAETEVHFELTGYLDVGAAIRAQAVGEWFLSWAKIDGSWKISQWKWERSAWAASTHRLFTDVTGQALGHNDSYRDQLLPSIDSWRASLDAALGMTVFGHHGVSFGDVDGDGDADLYVSQPSGLPNRLFRNEGNLRFTDITEVSGTGALDSTSMALIADVDGDSDQDLVLVGSIQPILMLNDGSGHFAPAPGAFHFSGAERAQLTSAAMADYDRDGDLDLYVCAYRHQGTSSTHGPPSPYHDANNGPPNILFRNLGDGSFEDATAESGIDENNTRFSFAASWGDYDSDGWPDLYVANDFGRNNLYRNQGSGRFRDVAGAAGVEDIGAGMSVSWLDHDLDGQLDIYVGNMWSSAGQRVTLDPSFRPAGGRASVGSYRRHARGNSLFRGTPSGGFEDVSELSGTTAGRWAWSSDALDLNNDGYEEIYITNGYVTNSDTKDL